MTSHMGLFMTSGLRNLFREGVNLEVMSADNILEEIKVDGIDQSDEAKIKQLLGKRCAWKSPAVLVQVRTGAHSSVILMDKILVFFFEVVVACLAIAFLIDDCFCFF